MKELKEGLVHIYGDRLKGVYLYGSYARGEERHDSDIDAMIVLNDYQSYGKEIDRTGEFVSGLFLDYGVRPQKRKGSPLAVDGIKLNLSRYEILQSIEEG